MVNFYGTCACWQIYHALSVGVFAFDYPLSNVQILWLTFQLNPDWVQVPRSLKSQNNYIGIYPPIIEQHNQGQLITANMDQWILFGSFALEMPGFSEP